MTGTFLKSYMKKNGIRQNFIAEKTGIRPKILSDMLNEQRKIEVSEYFDICAAMGTNPTEMAINSGLYAVSEQK